MLQPPPARTGMREDEVDTPALLIDLDAFEANLDTMAKHLEGTGARKRAPVPSRCFAMVSRLASKASRSINRAGVSTSSSRIPVRAGGGCSMFPILEARRY